MSNLFKINPEKKIVTILKPCSISTLYGVLSTEFDKHNLLGYTFPFIVLSSAVAQVENNWTIKNAHFVKFKRVKIQGFI